MTGGAGFIGSAVVRMLVGEGVEVLNVDKLTYAGNLASVDPVAGLPNYHFLKADVCDAAAMARAFAEFRPEGVLHLAAESHVDRSIDGPGIFLQTNVIGTYTLLEAARAYWQGLQPAEREAFRFLLISTDEVYGSLGPEGFFNEHTNYDPRSPYSVAKLYGFWIMKNYRESYGMYCCNGILFNHESERLGENFVTRKITLAACRIVQGFQDKLYLGNLDARRDWGYARDYVECMWLILQQPEPDDFVIATGEMHTVREFCTVAFKEAGIELRWEGEGVNEKGIDVKTGKVLVEVDPKYFRPCEVDQLLGNPAKAKKTLGWNPTKTSFEELVRIMVRHDMKFVKKLYIKAQMAE